MSRYFLFALGCFLLLAACQDSGDVRITTNSSSPTAEIPPLPTLNPDEVTLGQQVYTANCARCHGANLEGEADWKLQNEDNSFRAPPHDVSGHTWHHDDTLLLEAIRSGGARLPDNIGGTSNMPAFDQIITEEEIQAVLAYIKSTWPADTREIQWEQTVRTQP